MRNLRSIVSVIWNGPARIGNYLGWDWLIYNPGVFLEFDMVAKRNAPCVARAISRCFPQAHRILDVGCGTGRFVAALRAQGMHAEGVERGRLPRALSALRGIPLAHFDLTSKRSLDAIASTYDIAMSLEVGEHIPGNLSHAFASVLCRAANIVVLSCAPPGQAGHGHINCQPKQYWEDVMATLDFERDLACEAMFREELTSAGRPSGFLVNNCMIFVRRTQGGD